MRLIAGGDSFVWGSELKDHKHGGPKGYSLSTYPALLAKHYSLDYECIAYPGIGNKEISARVLKSLSNDSMVIVSWTWQSRDNTIDSDDVIQDLRDVLIKSKTPFLFTCADNCVLPKHISEDYRHWWMFPPGINPGQTISPRGFYQWAVEEGYECGSEGHPLEAAHLDAAQMMSDRFLTLISERP